MKSITNMLPSKTDKITSDDHRKANELNDFILRFHVEDFTNAYMSVLDSFSNDINVGHDVTG